MLEVRSLPPLRLMALNGPQQGCSRGWDAGRILQRSVSAKCHICGSSNRQDTGFWTLEWRFDPFAASEAHYASGRCRRDRKVSGDFEGVGLSNSQRGCPAIFASLVGVIGEIPARTLGQ